MNRRALFRTESEQARSNAWLGRVVLTRPLAFSLLAGTALVFALALGAFFVLGEYTRKARVVGVLAPAQGVVRIIAQQAGVVEAVHAAEGQQVDKDAPLVVLGDGRAGRTRQDIGAAIGARVAERREALARQRDHVLANLRIEQEAARERAGALAREIGQIDAEIGFQRRRSEIANAGAGRARGLEIAGFLSRTAVERDEDAALEHEGRLETLRRTRMGLDRERASVQMERGMALARSQSQLAAIDAQRATVEQEAVERDLQYHAAVVAPSAGVVATVLVERGQMVTAGTALLALIPADATLEAHLYAPSRSIGFVHAGQPVLLRYLAYPHQKFGMQRASVIAVSRNSMAPGELGFTPPDGSREPLYRIKARLDAQAILAYGRIESLQPGMQVEADILLDRRRLVEWIFEPLLGLAGRT